MRPWRDARPVTSPARDRIEDAPDAAAHPLEAAVLDAGPGTGPSTGADSAAITGAAVDAVAGAAADVWGALNGFELWWVPTVTARSAWPVTARAPA